MAAEIEVKGAAVSATDQPATRVQAIDAANLNAPEHARPQLTNTPVKSPSAPRPSVKPGK